ncbi:MAG: murein hydrolase activator EnvC family protein [Acidimicrobiales bacterium]
MLHRAPLALLVTVFATVLVVVVTPAAGDPVERVDYRPPVDGPVVDAFRPPVTPFGPGNRGLEYRTVPSTPVRAAAAGLVVFAGQVGGSLHVSIDHRDGLRTSYSFLASIAVRRGQVVGQGDIVGTAGDRLHFSARAGDVYLDPASLFAASGPTRVRLVPDRSRPRRPDGPSPAGLQPPVDAQTAAWVFGRGPG